MHKGAFGFFAVVTFFLADWAGGDRAKLYIAAQQTTLRTQDPRSSVLSNTCGASARDFESGTEPKGHNKQGFCVTATGGRVSSCYLLLFGCVSARGRRATVPPRQRRRGQVAATSQEYLV